MLCPISRCFIQSAIYRSSPHTIVAWRRNDSLTHAGPLADPKSRSPFSRPDPAAPSHSPSLNPPKSRRRVGIYVAGGLLVYGLTTYGVYIYWTLTSPSATPLPPQDADVSSRYDSTASHFDQDVSFIERISGINHRRRHLVSQAQGDVLEVSVGTGRNALYYNTGKLKSVTFVDQSGPMLDIARKKWRALHPHYEQAYFYTQPAQHPLPDLESVPREGFTTVIQTMGVCSTPHPSATLDRLGKLAHPTEGRVLLLEHGRSHYDWINWMMDKSAAKHADRHGCWFNRDIGKILEQSDLAVEHIERSQFGTLWYIEARPLSKTTANKEPDQATIATRDPRNQKGLNG